MYVTPKQIKCHHDDTWSHRSSSTDDPITGRRKCQRIRRWPTDTVGHVTTRHGLGLIMGSPDTTLWPAARKWPDHMFGDVIGRELSQGTPTPKDVLFVGFFFLCNGECRFSLSRKFSLGIFDCGFWSWKFKNGLFYFGLVLFIYFFRKINFR